jgi:hypothetical protein
MTARQQRSAPTYFTLKSCSKSSSTIVSIGPCGGRAARRRPAVDQNVQPAELACRLRDRALHLLFAGDIGGKGNDAPVRLMRQLPRRRLQVGLVARHDRHIHALARQFPRNGLADAPAAAGHDRVLALQSKVHGNLRLLAAEVILPLRYVVRTPSVRKRRSWHPTAVTRLLNRLRRTA